MISRIGAYARCGPSSPIWRNNNNNNTEFSYLPLIAWADDHTHYITFFNFFKSLGNISTIIIIIITDLYSAFRSEDTEALDAAQED